MITGTENTQLFALKSILKQWEVKLTLKMQLGALKTAPQFKKACMGHMNSLFQLDDSFNELKGRECYNNIVGALVHAGVMDSKFVKEVYTKKEVAVLNRKGMTLTNISII